MFLSSAAEDSEQAEAVRKRLARLGFDIVRLQHGAPGPDPAERIEEAVGGASAFLALLSDNYLASAWCMAEATAAIKAEEQLRSAHPPIAFIYVLEISKTQAPEATALSIYVHLNAAGTADWDAALDDLPRRLGRLPNLAHRVRWSPAADMSPLSSAIAGRNWTRSSTG